MNSADLKLIEAITRLTEVIEKQGMGKSSQGPAEVLLSITPMVGIVFGCTLLFFFMLWRYKQNKELIKTNKYQPTTYHTLRTWGLLMGCLSAVIGLPMTILFMVIATDPYSILGGLIPFSAGIGFLLFYFFTRNKA